MWQSADWWNERRSKPRLSPHQLSVWPPFGTMWLVECTLVRVSFQRTKACHSLQLIVADISRHQGTCANIYFEVRCYFVVVLIYHSLYFVAMSDFVRQTWRSLFGVFARNIHCDVLIGWRCLGDWHSGTLYRQLPLIYNLSITAKDLS